MAFKVGVSKHLKTKIRSPWKLQMLTHRMIAFQGFLWKEAVQLCRIQGRFQLHPVGPVKKILGDGSTVPTTNCPWPKRGPFKLLRLHANGVIICIWKDLLLSIHLLVSLKQRIHSKLVASHGVLAMKTEEGLRELPFHSSEDTVILIPSINMLTQCHP